MAERCKASGWVLNQPIFQNFNYISDVNNSSKVQILPRNV